MDNFSQGSYFNICSARRLIVFILTMIFFSLSGQVDDLRLVLNEESASTQERIDAAFSIAKEEGYSGQAIPVMKKALFMSKQNGLDTSTARCYEYLGFMNYFDGSLDSSIYYYSQGLRQYENLRWPSKATQMIKDRGLSKHKMGNLEEALKDYLLAFTQYQNLADSNGICTILNRIGGIHRDQKDFKVAIEYYERALNIATRIKDFSTMADASGNQGIIYQRLDSLELAIHYFAQTLDISREQGLKRRIGTCLNNLGALYLKQKSYGFASSYLQDAAEIYAQSTTSNTLCNIRINQGKVALAQDQRDNAIEYCLAGLGIAKRAGNLENQKNALECLVESHQLLGPSQQLVEYLISLQNTKDSLYRISSIREVTALEMQHQFDQQQSELAAVQSQKDLVSRWTKYSLLLGLMGLGVIAFLIFKASKRRKKTLKLVQNKNDIISKSLNEKDLLLREIHHRVKNNLQVVTSLLSLQSSHIEEPNALEAINESRDRVQSMALIHQNLYQEGNLTGIEIKQYFEKLIGGLFDSYNIEPSRVQLTLNIENLNLDVDTVIPIGLIVNELVSNALKYAFPDGRMGKIEVGLTEQDNSLHLQVSDNGVGINHDWKEEGLTFGYQLIHAFREKLEADLEVVNDQGTKVTMTIHDYLKAG